MVWSIILPASTGQLICVLDSLASYALSATLLRMTVAGDSTLDSVQSDKVLQNTIRTLKELEGRCNATAQQGDAMADRIEEIQHRVSIIQQTMLPPTLGADDSSDDNDVLK